MKTHRGKNINMEQLFQENRKSVAVGNIPVNAQGDRLSSGGKVDQTIQQTAHIFYKENDTTITTTSLKDPVDSKELPVSKKPLKKSSKETIEDNGDIVVDSDKK